MLEHITSDVNGYAERRDGCIDLCLEQRSNHFDDQHEHCRHIYRDSNRYEGLHRFGHGYTHIRSESDGFCEQPDLMRELIACNPDSHTERRNRCSDRSEEHTSELQSHSFISYAVFCLKKKKT